MNEEISRPGRWRARSSRFRPAALLAGCLLAALAVPAAAQPVAPPGWWLAESPGTSGARFGLGVDYLFEDVDSLLNTSFTETVTLRGPQAGGPPQVIPGDPALNNRKFDYGFEVRSWGVQAPIALRRLRLGGGATLYPSLVLEVATTEATFDFHDRSEPGDSTSVSGRGVSWAAGLEGVAALGRGGRWFLAGGYRFRSLPEFDLERSPGFDSNAGVVEDEVRLGGGTHLASLRLGRILAGGTVSPYIGVRGRWSELEIDDRLRFVDAAGDLFDLTTSSRFDSDSTLGLVGLDARLRGPLVGRAEVTFGDGDVAALVKAVYLVPSRGGFRPPDPGVAPVHHRGAEGRARRVEEAFSEIRRQFSSEAQRLGSSSAPGYVEAAVALIDRMEHEAAAALRKEGYHGIADWLGDRADEAREGLRRSAPMTRSAFRSPPAPGVLLASLGPPPQDAGPANPGGWLDGFARALALIFVRAEDRCLEIELGFTIEGVDRASVLVHLRGVQPNKGTLIRANRDPQLVRIGSYSYQVRVKEPQAETSTCQAVDRGPLLQCPLDLVGNPVRTVDCEGASSGRECVYGEPHGQCGDPPP
jgi:hypothetical protein